MRSPIETRLIKALVENAPPRTVVIDNTDITPVSAAVYGDGWGLDYKGNRNSSSSKAFFDACERDERPVGLYSQVRIGEYRADLLLNYHAMVLVECDGHDFHERTKQQAAYDRERDRYFLARGLVTVRFTGSEIVNYPEKCVRDLFAVFETQECIVEALRRNWFEVDGRSKLDTATGLRDEDGHELHWNPGKGSTK